MSDLTVEEWCLCREGKQKLGEKTNCFDRAKMVRARSGVSVLENTGEDLDVRRVTATGGWV